MKRVTITDIIISSLVLVLTAATLVPALGRAQRAALDAKCQSNLRRLAEAMEAYAADNSSLYPTNRYRGIAPMAVIPLSQSEPLPGETEPPLMQYGPNWVEALYSSIKSSAAQTGQDWKSFRRCPNATTNLYPKQPTSGVDLHWAATYVFNGSLIEQPQAIVRDAKKLMLIRELGRLTIAVLRPSNIGAASSTGSSIRIPQNPFLHNLDTLVGDTSAECKLHGDGSYVLFADGHVDHFTVDFFPDTSQITATTSWDSATGQWWNYAPGSDKPAPYLKSIAITP